MENKELLEVLGRIADALEEITGATDELRECVAYTPPRYHMQEGFKLLRIGGTVQTD